MLTVTGLELLTRVNLSNHQATPDPEAPLHPGLKKTSNLLEGVNNECDFLPLFKGQ